MQETIHSYLSTMKHQSRSYLIKLLFADLASVVSSTISEDPVYQNQIQSQDDEHGSQAIDIIEDDIVHNEESEAVQKTQSKKRKRRINEDYEHQSIIGDEMPTDSPKSTRRSSRSDAFILSDINTRKSRLKWMFQIIAGTLLCLKENIVLT